MPAPELPEIEGFVVVGPDPWGADRDRFEAIQEGSRRRVAVQLIPPLYPDERRQVTALLDRPAGVRHEHLGEAVTVAPAADALVLPLPAHGTLARLTPPLASARDVAATLAPVADALAALHEAGLAHGQVAADVVGLDEEGTPRLLGAGVRAALHTVAPREVPAPDRLGDVMALLALVDRQVGRLPDRDLVYDALDDLAEADDLSAQAVADRLYDLVEPESSLTAAAAAAVLAEPIPGQPDHDAPEPEPLPDTEPAPSAAEPTVPSEPVAEAEPVAEPEPEPQPGDEAGPEPLRTPAQPDPTSRPATEPLPGAATATRARPAVAAESPGLVERLRSRRVLLVAAPLLLVALVALGWRMMAGTGEASSSAVRPDTATAAPDLEDAGSSAGVELCGAPGPAPEQVPPTPDNWAEVVRDLYTARSAALVTGQTDLLCDVYDPRSPGLESDLELEAAYARQDVRPDQLVFVVERADLVSAEGALVTLEIVDRLEPYNLVGADGTVVAELPGIEPATWQARLVPDATGTEWRFG